MSGIRRPARAVAPGPPRASSSALVRVANAEGTRGGHVIEPAPRARPGLQSPSPSQPAAKSPTAQVRVDGPPIGTPTQGARRYASGEERRRVRIDPKLQPEWDRQFSYLLEIEASAESFLRQLRCVRSLAEEHRRPDPFTDPRVRAAAATVIEKDVEGLRSRVEDPWSCARIDGRVEAVSELCALLGQPVPPSVAPLQAQARRTLFDQALRKARDLVEEDKSEGVEPLLDEAQALLEKFAAPSSEAMLAGQARVAELRAALRPIQERELERWFEFLPHALEAHPARVDMAIDAILALGRSLGIELSARVDAARKALAPKVVDALLALDQRIGSPPGFSELHDALRWAGYGGLELGDRVRSLVHSRLSSSVDRRLERIKSGTKNGAPLYEIKEWRAHAESEAALIGRDIRAESARWERVAWKGRRRPESQQAGRVGLGQLLDIHEPTPTGALLDARVRAVRDHQNTLRMARGVAELVSTPGAVTTKEVLPGSGARRIDGLQLAHEERDKYRHQGATGELIACGDVVLRAAWGDVFGLNFAYRFEGERLAEVVPFARWVVDRLDDPIFGLVRQMGSEEAEIWRDGSARELRLRKGEKRLGYDTGVLHFQLGTAPWCEGRSTHCVQWDVPKKLVQAWADAGAIHVGGVGAHHWLELVLREDRWSDLTRLARFELEGLSAVEVWNSEPR